MRKFAIFFFLLSENSPEKLLEILIKSSVFQSSAQARSRYLFGYAKKKIRKKSVYTFIRESWARRSEIKLWNAMRLRRRERVRRCSIEISYFTETREIETREPSLIIISPLERFPPPHTAALLRTRLCAIFSRKTSQFDFFYCCWLHNLKSHQTANQTR